MKKIFSVLLLSLFSILGHSQSLGTAPYYISPVDSSVKIPATINGTLRNVYPFDLGKPYFPTIQRFLDSMAAVNSRIGAGGISYTFNNSSIKSTANNITLVNDSVPTSGNYAYGTNNGRKGFYKSMTVNLTPGYRDGDYVKVDSVNNTLVTFTPTATSNSGSSSGSLDSIRVLAARPATGNIWYQTTDRKLHIKYGGYDIRFSPLDSSVISQFSDLDFITKTGLSNSGGVWTGLTGTTTDWLNHGVATQYLPSTTDGYIQFQFAAADALNTMLAFNTTNADERYASNNSTKATTPVNYEVAVWVSGATNQINCIDNNVVIANIGTATIGDYFRLNVVGSVVKIQKSSDGTTWTDIRTCTFTRGVNMYPTISAVLNAKVYYPKGFNLQ